MEAILQPIYKWIDPVIFKTIIKVGLILIIGIPVVKGLANRFGKRAREKHSLQTEMLVRKAINTVGYGIVIYFVLNMFGLKMTAILGALGVFGLAIGFASQTSVSNIISGLFLLVERPFEIGDVVQLGATVGTVLSIDTLSVKIKTFDGRFVRIPSENIVKAETMNITRYPVRRLDLEIRISYQEDVEKVIRILKELVAKNQYCLKDPEPTVFLSSLQESNVLITMNMWHEKSNVVNLLNSINLQMKERFDTEEPAIPIFMQVKIPTHFPLQ